MMPIMGVKNEALFIFDLFKTTICNADQASFAMRSNAILSEE